MKKTSSFLIALVLGCLLSLQSQAQINITVTVFEVSTTIGDCDGFFGGDSDPTWWWTGADVDDQCFQVAGQNGPYTTGTSQLLYDESFNCPSDVPGSISARFRGCEDDGAGCVLGAFIGICDGSAADRTDNISLPTTPGTYTVGPFCANSTGCSGTWCYRARIVVTGSFVTPPANDDLCNASQITLGTTITGNNTCGTVETSEVDPSPGTISPSNTTWHYFTAPASGHVIVSTDHGGTSFDTEIAVYHAPSAVCPGTNWGGLTEVGANDDIILLFDLDSEVELECLTPGDRYYIQVDGNDASDFGNYRLSVTSVGPALLTNDDLCNALNLGTLPSSGTIGSNNYNNFCGTVEAGEPNPSCLWGPDQTMWFTFTTSATPGYNVLVQATNDPLNRGDQIDLQLAIYSSSNGTCTGTLTEIDCDYDIIFFGEDMDVGCLEPNTNYFVQVDGSSLNTQGYFGLTITDNGIPQATNDDICEADSLGRVPALGAISLTNENNFCATVEPGEPDPLSHGIDQTVWYSFIPPPSGAVEIDLLDNGSDDIDLQISVWESSNDSCTGFFAEVESYDAPLSNSITGGEKLRLKCLDTSKTYFIQVDGTDWIPPLDVLREGDFDLIITDYNVTAAPNDSICEAIFLGNPTGTPVSALNQTNFCADNLLEPIPSEFGTNQTVWYSFIAPSTGRVTVSAVSDPNNTGDYIDLQLAVFSTTDDSCYSPTTEIKSEYNDLLEFPPLSRDEDMFVECLTPGRLYYIMVDGSDDPDDVDGFFNITVTEEPGPPPITNDDICDATYLGQVPNTGSIGNNSQHNFCATVETGEPVASAFGPDQTVWYTFRAPASGNITISATNDPLNLGDNIDLQVAVFASDNDTCTGNFTEVDSDYDPGFFSEDLTVTCLDSGRLYFIQVDGVSLPPPLDVLQEGYFGISITPDPPTVPLPTNDSICSAFNLGTLTSGGSSPLYSGSNYCAGEEPGEPNVSGGNNFFNFSYDETVWFTFTTPPNPGTTTISVTNTSGIDANINVYSTTTWPTCNFSDLILYGQADNLLSTDVSLDLSCLNPSTTYYIQLDGLDLIGDKGTFDLRVSDDGNPVSVPVNDSICNAINLGTVPAGGNSIQHNGNNFCAKEEAGEPNVSGAAVFTNINYDETVWYTFTTSATPGVISINVTGAIGIDASVVCYSVNNFPSCNFSDLVEVDQADNLLSNNVTLNLSCLRPNTTYYIQVDGNDLLGNYGTFDIQVADNGAANVYAPFDSICNAANLGVVPVGSNTATLSTNNFCGTEEPGEPNVSGSQIITSANYDETVWFTFTTPATPGLTTVDVFNTSGIDANITVYSVANFPTCNFSNLTQIADFDDALSSDASLDLPCLIPNTTYYVQVDGNDVLGNYGTFDIRILDDGSMNAYASNDSICNAISMGVVPSGGSTTTLSGSNECAGEENNEPNVSGLTNILSTQYDETVWYTFTTSATPGTITIDIFNTSGIYGVVNCYAVTPNTSCSFNDLTFLRGATTLTFGPVSVDLVCLAPNTTYYVQVDGLDVLGDEGTFDIRATDNGTATAAPANDLICNAVYLGNANATTLGPVAGNNNCAGVEANEPGVSSNDETVWYKFVAPNSGRATISINSVQYIDANFSLYHAASGSCDFDSLTQVGNNHDNLISFDVSHTEECLIPADTYYVQIDGGDLFGDYGDFTITITDPQPTFTGPTNDPCSNATTIPIGNTPCQGSGAWNVYNYGTPTVSRNDAYVQGCGDNCGDVWFTFTMPASGTVLMEGDDEQGSLFNQSELTVIAYSGNCNSLTPINCDQGGFFSDPEYYISAPPGTQIYLQVFDNDGNAINTDFGLCITDRCGADDCLQATPMTPGIPYCFDTDGANGENTPTDPGYDECGDGTDPGASVYFSYVNNCASFRVTINANIGGLCILNEPTDGLSFAIYQDSTVCDDVPDNLLDCEQTDACLGNTWFFTKVYSGVPIGTQHIIQLDGFDLTGDNNGTIQIDELCVLPVEYLAFAGHHDEGRNILDWRAAGEVETGRFEIEKSLDGTDFNVIGAVDGTSWMASGQGGSSSQDSYDFRYADNQPAAGHNYYRLRQIDQDGNVTLSQVIDIYLDNLEPVKIAGIYPNPAKDLIFLDLIVSEAGEYDLSLTDLYGKILLEKVLELNPGLNQHKLNLSSISAGMYLLILKEIAGNSKDFAKIIKQ